MVCMKKLTKQLPLEDGEVVDEKQEPSKKKRHGDEGSRWVALIILVITIVSGIIFYVVGNKSLPLPSFSFEDFNMTAEYVIE
jgi:flagellar basal body-associated protein FliL